MTHPRIVTVPTVGHHDTLGFALSLEKMREALHSEPGVRLDLHLSGEALVRRQIIWRNSRRKLAECGPRLGG